MPFVSHDPRSGKGGKRPGAGAPKKQVVANRLEATKIAEETLAKAFGDLLKTAFKVSHGILRKRFYPKEHKWAGRVYYEREYDSAMLRFLIERFVPPAKVAVDVKLKTGFEKLIQDLEAEAAAEKKRIEAARDVTQEAWEADPEKKPDDREKLH